MSRLVIAGQGAIGSIVAAHCELQHIPYAVSTRLGKTQQVDYLHHATGQQLAFTPPTLTTFKPSDILLLPLKAYQIIPCLDALTLPASVPLILLHNGMGTLEQVQQRYPNHPVIAGITSYAAFRQQNGQVNETGQGTTQLGWIANPQAEIQTTVQQRFDSLLGPCQWQHNIQLALWHKLAINAAINPLTAIHSIPNGALQQATFAPTISAICAEIAAVMGKLGLPQTADKLQQQVYAVINASAQNFSSMNRDIAAGRPSEIDYINGYIIRQATQLGIEVPVIKQLMTQLLEIQNNHIPGH
ncbi:ketopantoate reductase family protein [Neptunicella sp. SCSIO 80796]|uniref:ketopantoate reductase family protein n=1 Tax=Neptunicella plasticusilytica TaxID=3117012 RepID=UPI003A4E13D0